MNITKTKAVKKSVIIISFLIFASCSLKTIDDFFPVENVESINAVKIKRMQRAEKDKGSFELDIYENTKILKLVNLINICKPFDGYHDKTVVDAFEISFYYDNKVISYPIIYKKRKPHEIMPLYSKGETGYKIGVLVCDGLTDEISKYVSK